jgi:hypothetical protein
MTSGASCSPWVLLFLASEKIVNYDEFTIIGSSITKRVSHE